MREHSGYGRVLGILLLALFSLDGPLAQDRGGATVVFADGPEFSVVRDGAVKRFLPADDILGYELRDGDLLQTGRSTFVEVQLKPKGSMLKLAENSSFVFRGIEDPSSASLELIYGRVRAKVAKVAGGESFFIRSRQTAAGVRGTDFGFDSVLVPGPAGPAASVSVYAFSGSVAVVPVEEKAAPAISLQGGEALTVDLSSAVPVVERMKLDDEVVEFWRSYDFKGTPPIAPPPSGLPVAAAEAPAAAPAAQPAEAAAPVIKYITPDFRPYRETIALKNTTIGIAALTNILSLAALAFGAYSVSTGNTSLGEPVLWGSAAAVGVSAGILGFSFFIPSPGD